MTGVRRREPSALMWLAVLLVQVIALGAVAIPGTAWSVYRAQHTNGTNTVTAASSFPDYPTLMGTAPQFWYRGDDAASGADAPTATDASGNGQSGIFDGPTNGPTLWWKLNETTGTSASDASGNVNAGTLAGATPAAAWTPGYRKGAVTLDGVDDRVVASRAALDSTADFTVSAWVHLAGPGLPGRDVYAVSQGGTNQSAYALQYLHDKGGVPCRCWAFRMTASDSATLPTSAVVSVRSGDNSATAGTWTHLVGVRDGTSMRLYVDGVDVSRDDSGTSGPQVLPATWSAGSPLQAGAASVDGTTATGHWPGALDDVKTWQRALDAHAVRDEATGTTRAAWTFDEGTGTGATSTTGATATGASAALTLHGQLGWTASGRRGSALSFPPTATAADYAETSAVLDTQRSFSVSAWVYPTQLAGDHRTVVSQLGDSMSAFWLQYRDDTQRWSFTTADSDAVASPARFAQPSTPPALNTWTHLLGVYDDEKDEARLYVDGSLAGSEHRPALWGATGPTAIGRGIFAGTLQDSFVGRIDDVQLLNRALDDAQARDLYAGRTPDVTPTGFTAGVPGALDGPERPASPNRAVAFAGSTSAYNPQPYVSPDTFTAECWFRTDVGGGVLFGLSTRETNPLGISNGTKYDRMVYMRSDGRLSLGVHPWTFRTITSGRGYADGEWHHVAASLGSAGLRLYVDGVLVAHEPSITHAQDYTGFWRWGGSSTELWSGASGNFFVGTLDEFSVTGSQLPDRTIAEHAFSDY